MNSMCCMNLPDRTLEAGLWIVLEFTIGLSLIESVCCCIPTLPWKCGRHLEEIHKSAVRIFLMLWLGL